MSRATDRLRRRLDGTDERILTYVRGMPSFQDSAQVQYRFTMLSRSWILRCCGRGCLRVRVTPIDVSRIRYGFAPAARRCYVIHICEQCGDTK